MVASGKGSDHQVPDEEVGAANLREELESVVEVPMEGEAAEGYEAAGGKGFVHEAGGDHLGMELAEVPHGCALLETGEDRILEVAEVEVCFAAVAVSVGSGEVLWEEDEMARD